MFEDLNIEVPTFNVNLMVDGVIIKTSKVVLVEHSEILDTSGKLTIFYRCKYCTVKLYMTIEELYEHYKIHSKGNLIADAIKNDIIVSTPNPKPK